MTRCVGHRGAAGLAPENSLAAYAAGIAAGADALECDVHRTRDGELVLIHDAEVSKTTNGHGQVGNLSFSDVRRLNCAAHFGDGKWAVQRIPTLAELLDLAQGRCAVQIEIKVPAEAPYPNIEAEVVEALRSHVILDSAQIISFDGATLSRVRALEPHLPLGYLASRSSLPEDLRRDGEALVAVAQAYGATFLSLERQFITERHLQVTRRLGLGLAVWTVNDRREMERMVRKGVDAITTDRPDTLRQVLDNRPA